MRTMEYTSCEIKEYLSLYIAVHSLTVKWMRSSQPEIYTGIYRPQYA